jgi:ketosteroid isomerase-like protein
MAAILIGAGGPDQILAMWREVLRDLPDFRIELEEVVRDQGDVLVVAVSFQGMGRASGADVRAKVFQAISFNEGQVTRVQGFQRSRRSPRSRGTAGVAALVDLLAHDADRAGLLRFGFGAS